MLIYTIGHSNRSLDEFVTRLKDYDIERLVDVRTRPYSRFCPWFNKNSLNEQLATFGIVYDFKGDRLGGFGENLDYDGAIAELVELAKTERIAIMCSEADFKKCHRHTMIKPDLVKHSVKVEHISHV